MDKKCDHKIGILDDVDRLITGYVSEEDCPACLKDKLEKANSKIREMESTYEFGNNILGNIVLPRAREGKFDGEKYAEPMIAKWISDGDKAKEKLKRAVEACRAVTDGVKGTGNSCHLSYEGYRLCSKVLEENLP